MNRRMKRSLEHIQLNKIEFSFLNRNLVSAPAGAGVEWANGLALSGRRALLRNWAGHGYDG
jgi:hypothetical protein